MADVIQLLPDHVANQIAAGEVVQRPASVVKELLENAIDAGASQIKLFLKDAGKALIQVIDNGCGMSETDARMSFERHATSKIRDAKDLFSIRTMGFRGEALASVAAVAQVEMRTRRAKEELGTRIVVEDSTVKVQEACQSPAGTSIAVKNLFYNVPARRNFLKSDPIEMRHIIEEFQRVAMAHPDLFFSLHQNDQEMFHLPPGNLRQRVVKIFGDAVNKQLVPVQQETNILKINGFVSKPDYYKKSRGEQLFFVNKRFIKSPYLHVAVVAAFEELLPAESFPLYVLFLDIDPSRIDVNVHPTKQEIKFDDEKLVFNYLKAGIKHALGSHNVTPSIDFETEPAFEARPVEMPFIRSSGSGGRASREQDDGRHERNIRHWEKLYEGLNTPSDTSTAPFAITEEKEDVTSQPSNISDFGGLIFQSAVEGPELLSMDDEEGSFSKNKKEPYQIHGQYIISPIKSGFLMIDQQAASERILYERYLGAFGSEPVGVQKILFPKQIEFSPADAVLFRDILPEINRLGFEIDEFGGNSFIIHGAPAEVSLQGGEEGLLEKLLEQYKRNLELDTGVHDNLARALARSAALRRSQLTTAEMQNLLDQLFACAMPYSSPSGRLCFVKYELEELHKRFASAHVSI